MFLNQSEQTITNDILQSQAYTVCSEKVNELFIHFLSDKESNEKFNQIFDLVNNNYPIPNQLLIYQKDSLQNTMLSQLPVKQAQKKKTAYKSETIVNPKRKNLNKKKKQRDYAQMSVIPGDLSRTTNPNIVPKLDFIVLTCNFGKKFNEKEEAINTIFVDNTLNEQQFEDFLLGILEIPIFCRVFFSEKEKNLPQEKFLEFWKNNFSQKQPKEILFDLLTKKKKNKNFIQRDEFDILLKEIIEHHPDYDLIKEDKNFQDQFRTTIKEIIFYILDHDQDGRIHRREFYQSNFYDNLMNISEYNDEDSKKFNFLSYDYFYVICCLFNDLDENQDGFITKKDMEKYQDHNLSSLVINRIFSQISYKFQSGNNQMNYQDFIWFLMSEESKNSNQSINYWFKIIDLNSDGVIRKRIYAIENEDYEFRDILCMFMDLFKKNNSSFVIEDFLKKPFLSHNFFDILTNYGKCWDFLTKDSNTSPVCEQFTDWVNFSHKMHKILTYGYDDEQQDEEENKDQNSVSQQGQ